MVAEEEVDESVQAAARDGTVPDRPLAEAEPLGRIALKQSPELLRCETGAEAVGELQLGEPFAPRHFREAERDAVRAAERGTEHILRHSDRKLELFLRIFAAAQQPEIGQLRQRERAKFLLPGAEVGEFEEPVPGVAAAAPPRTAKMPPSGGSPGVPGSCSFSS